MTSKTLKQLAATAIVCATASTATFAVGNGLPFIVDENAVPGAVARTHNANSVDFTYHSCVNMLQPAGDPPQFRESGYFWVSSYQAPASVVPSQINHFAPNGYRIYARYTYAAQFVNLHNPSPSGTRINYVAMQQPAFIQLFLDPDSDTVLGLQPCQSVILSGTDDDILIGFSAALNFGEKSETANVAANGDFELRFGNFTFTYLGQQMFQLAQPGPFYRLVMNANITQLIGGGLLSDHRTEGSGNLFFWPQPQD